MEPTRNVTGFSGELDSYFQALKGERRMTADEERALAKAWRDRGCRASRERLITANLRLVITIAKRYMHRGTPLDELIAEANVGLIQAVDRFDPRAGVRFSTYAVYWIRHSIATVFARASSRPRLSRDERADLAAMESAEMSFLAAHGWQASIPELAGELRWHPEKVRAVQELAAARTRPGSGHDPAMATIRLCDERAEPAEGVACRVDGLLSALSADERRIVELRFGLDGARARTIGMIASLVKVPPRLVRTRLEIAMRKLGRHAGAEPECAASGVAPAHARRFGA